jgi:hypothetical protein
MKFYETDDFKRQQQEWYGKLAEAGFNDAETVIANDHKLKQYSCRREPLNNNKLHYYQAITEYVNTQSFDCEIDEIVMFMRADGIKIKDISTELKKRGLERSHRETIRYIIRKYEVRWGVKKYKPSQMSFSRSKNGRQD